MCYEPYCAPTLREEGRFAGGVGKELPTFGIASDEA